MKRCLWKTSITENWVLTAPVKNVKEMNYSAPAMVATSSVCCYFRVVFERYCFFFSVQFRLYFCCFWIFFFFFAILSLVTCLSLSIFPFLLFVLSSFISFFLFTFFFLSLLAFFLSLFLYRSLSLVWWSSFYCLLYSNPQFCW